MRCEIAYLSNKWSPASQDGIGFRISNEINDFVRSRMLIVAISCGMALFVFHRMDFQRIPRLMPHQRKRMEFSGCFHSTFPRNHSVRRKMQPGGKLSMGG